MGRTKRRRKLDERHLRNLEREIQRRVAAGEPILLLQGPKTKARPAPLFLGEPIDDDSDYAKRLAQARARLQGPGDPET
jgi:hypothetical protein